MASTLVREPFHRSGWVYEEKYDGWRMLAFKDGSRVRLISRQGVDHTARFRELAAAITQLRAPDLVLDGEVCVFDEDLVSQFHLLGRPDPSVIATPPVFMAFDCLRALGLDVRGLPLHRRRAMLEEELADARGIFPARRLADHGLAAWAIVKERGYEGLVAKDNQRASSSWTLTGDASDTKRPPSPEEGEEEADKGSLVRPALRILDLERIAPPRMHTIKLRHKVIPAA